MRPVLIVGVAALLVVAGCSGAPSPSDGNGTTTDAGTTSTRSAGEPTTSTPVDGDRTETTTTARPGPDLGIEVQNGELPYDPNTTWVRVQDLMDTNVSPPSAVLVVDPDAAGSTSAGGSVYINSKKEWVLAHEFTHSILLRAHDVPPSGSADERFAHDATIEGTAEYVHRAYERRYLGREPRTFQRLPDEPGRAYFLARYYYGIRYVRTQVDDPKEIPRLHRHPPNTSEQVLHGLAPGSEPPAEFAVTVPTRHLKRDATWQYGGRRRLGEIGVLMTLRTRLDTDLATSGADGWGNDRVVAFEQDGTAHFVWVIRWDDRANASEFERAIRRFRNASPPRAPPPQNSQGTPYRAFTDRVWTSPSPAIELRRIDARTTAVAFGSPGFVDATWVSVNGSVVTVGVRNETSAGG